MIFLFTVFIGITAAEVSDAELVAHILEKYPRIEMSRKDVQASQANELIAIGAFDLYTDATYLNAGGNYDYEFLRTRLVKPTSFFGLDLIAGFRQSSGDLPIYERQWETLSDGEVSVGFKIPLLRNFITDPRRAEWSRSRIEVARQKQELRVTELREVREALLIFWDWRLARERAKVYSGLLEIALTRDEWIKRRYSAGDVARFERDDNLRTVYQRKSLYLESEQALKEAEAALLVFVDDEQLRQRISAPPANGPITQWPTPRKAESLLRDIRSLLAEALERRPELASLSMFKQGLEVEQRLQANQYLPSLNLEAEYAKHHGTGPDRLDDHQRKIMLNFEMPLQYRRIRGLNQNVNARMSRVDNEKELLKRRIEQEITVVRNKLALALQRKELAQQELTLASLLEKGELQRFRRGETNVLIVNLREQAKAEAELRMAETSAEVLKSYVSLYTALGNIPNDG